MGRRIGTFGLINYRRHPENKNYIVFSFNTQAEADLFEMELKRRNVNYEKDDDTSREEDLYLFAVREGSLDAATKANLAVHTAFKKPTFQNKWIGYAFVVLFLFLVTLAIVGYIKNSGNGAG